MTITTESGKQVDWTPPEADRSCDELKAWLEFVDERFAPTPKSTPLPPWGRQYHAGDALEMIDAWLKGHGVTTTLDIGPIVAKVRTQWNDAASAAPDQIESALRKMIATRDRLLASGFTLPDSIATASIPPEAWFARSESTASVRVRGAVFVTLRRRVGVAQ